MGDQSIQVFSLAYPTTPAVVSNISGDGQQFWGIDGIEVFESGDITMLLPSCRGSDHVDYQP